MIIQDIALENRPRERFLKNGPEFLNDAELFAIILRTGTRGEKGEIGESVTDMSNRLIKEYGLENLFQCSLKELQKIKGIGPSKAMQLLAMAELNKRIKAGKIYEKVITNASDIAKHYLVKMKNLKKERLVAVFLDSKNKIIKDEIISIGTLDSSLIHPREIFHGAIKNSAASIILIHNHPSGNCKASEEDKEVTKRIIKAGELLNIKVLDHLIIGRDKYESLC